MKKIRRMKRIKRILVFIHIFIPVFFLLLFACLLLTLGKDDNKNSKPQHQTGIATSPQVQSYATMIYEQSEKYGIREYARYLLAIMQVETGGAGADVMQSLGNSGLPEHLKTPEKSIEQACILFASLLEKARVQGCDMETVIQAYNYGGGYINYVTMNGKEHNFTLASDFSSKQCNGKKVTYNNPIAIRTNGGWRYAYGNMFYVYLVKQYLAVDPLSGDVATTIIQEALKYKGWSHVYGGASPSTSFDCSGLVQWCYGAAGIELPRTAQAQYDFMQHITLEEAEPGDLVFFTGTVESGSYITHVGIYVGNNEMFHAGNPIGYGDLTSTYYKQHLVCAGRIKG